MASRTSSALPMAKPSGWAMSADDRPHLEPGFVADGHHRRRQGAGLVQRLHERAGADLHVEHDGVGPRRQLLAHDAAGDQRQRCHRAGHVAQGIHAPVGGGQVGALRRHHQPHVADRGDKLLGGELARQPGIDFSLSIVPPEIAQPPPRHLAHRHPGGRHQRGHHQRRLVAHAAAAVLVHHERRRRRQVEPLPRPAITSVSQAVSRAVMPRQTTAISQAAT